MAKHVDYYVSLNSPWTYLGSKRFGAMAQKHGADVTIWPVDFGSVFAVSGGLPLPKRAPQRQAYRMMELKRWRDHLGVKTTLEPKFFPANEVPAAKCVIALREQGRMADAIKVAHAVLAALWAEEKNTGDPATLQAIIAGCGLDAAAVIKASEAPGIAEKREAYTKQAIERGVFGAPSFVIDGEIFWGQDRLDFVDRKLAA
jgi:2-hydroxychromene-2-carboxylate isomerase